VNATTIAVLAQLLVNVNAPDSASVLETAVVTVTVRSPSLLPPTLEPPSFQGFALVGTSTSARVVQDPGGDYALLEMSFRLRTSVPGIYTIGPFEARVDSRTARSRPATIVMRAGLLAQPPSVPAPAIVRSARIAPGEAVSAASAVTPDTVYVGEQATYEVAVFVDETLLGQRTARYPSITPPDLRGTLAYELPPPSDGVPSRVVADRAYRPLVYQRAIFPLVAGRHVIPAGTLDYSTPTSTGFFAREEPRTLRLDSTTIVALPLPLAGRPQGFSGAVGSLRLERGVSSPNLRVGEPFTLRVRVLGNGNIRLLPRPVVTIPWADALTASESIVLEYRAGRVSGWKQFEWVVTPREAGPNEIPAIEYAYFNPATRRYELASTRSDRVDVASGDLAPVTNTNVVDDALPLKGSFRRTVPGTLWSRSWFVAVAIAAPLLPLFLAARRAHERRRHTNVPRERAGMAGPRKRDATSDLRHSFLASLEARLRLQQGGAADVRALRSRLLRRGISRATAEEAVHLSIELDRLVFDRTRGSDTRMAQRVRSCLANIDAEGTVAPQHQTTTRVSASFLLAMSVLMAQPDPSGARFVRGTELYEAREYAEAARVFLQLAGDHPRSPEAWANLGTAAYQDGDTVTAMLSWQRAIRLDPTDREARHNIARIVGPESTGSSYVPPYSPNTTAVVALVAWLISCAFAYRALHRRSATPGIAGMPFLLLCIVALAMSVLAHRRALDPQIAVVGNDLVSYLLPTLEAERIVRLSPGEIVRIVAEERGWLEIELNSRSAGWVNGENLMRVVVD
jgi:tetratricopeptide (TPR) repeat protein